MIIAIKTILFFFGLIFTVRFLADVVLRIIGQSKYYGDGDDWHSAYTHGEIDVLSFATNLPIMIATWTVFYLVNLIW